MVSVNSGSRVPGSSPGGKHCVAFNVPHSTQVYTWVPANLMLGVNMPWISIPSMQWQKNSSTCQWIPEQAGWPSLARTHGIKTWDLLYLQSHDYGNFPSKSQSLLLSSNFSVKRSKFTQNLHCLKYYNTTHRQITFICWSSQFLAHAS